MSQQIIKDQNIESLKTAARWPGADRATLGHRSRPGSRLPARTPTGYRYFAELAASPARPGAAAGARRVLPGPAGRGHAGGAGQAGPGRRPPISARRSTSAGWRWPGCRLRRPCRAGRRRPGVRPGRPRPVPGSCCAPRTTAWPRPMPCSASMTGPPRPTQFGPGAAPAEAQLDVRRLLGDRRRRVPFHLAQDPRARNPASGSPRATTSPTSRLSPPATASSRSTPGPPSTGSEPRWPTAACTLTTSAT